MDASNVTFTVRFVIALSFIAAVAAASPAPPHLAAHGQWKDDTYELWLSIESTNSRSDWNAEEEEPPLSMKTAIAIARRALEEMVGTESQAMICYEIGLQPRRTHSYYVVTFITEPTTDAFGGKDSFSPLVMPFAVLMDGTVLLPQKKPLKSAQPTRGKAPRG